MGLKNRQCKHNFLNISNFQNIHKVMLTHVYYLGGILREIAKNRKRGVGKTGEEEGPFCDREIGD